jgi:hypothetical protein
MKDLIKRLGDNFIRLEYLFTTKKYWVIYTVDCEFPCHFIRHEDPEVALQEAINEYNTIAKVVI